MLPRVREAPVGDEDTSGIPKASGQHDPEATDSGTNPSSRPLRPADEPGPPPRVTSINIPVGELKQNVEQVLVSVPRDKLKGHIESFARGNRRQFRIYQLYVEAASSLGIALALGIPLFTATFQRFGPFSASTLKAMCGVGAVLAMVVTITRFVSGLRLAIRRSEDYKGVGEVVQAIEENRDFPTST